MERGERGSKAGVSTPIRGVCATACAWEGEGAR